MHSAFTTASKVLLAALGLALLQSSHAVNISNGQRIYSSICSACHSSTVTNNVYGILAAANDPNLIRQTIESNPPMQFLGRILSSAEIEDVASYLGNHDGIDPERIFSWAERKYSDVLRPAGVSSQVAAGYYFRYYAQSDTYVGIRGGRVFYYAPGMSAPLDVGAAVYFLELAAADRIFNWAEWKYSDMLRPAGVSSQVGAGYYFRYYAQSDYYVGISGGRVFYYAPGMSAPLDVGAAVYFLELAAAANF